MEYLSRSFNFIQSKLSNKRKRSGSPSPYPRKKIHVVRPTHLKFSSFHFPAAEPKTRPSPLMIFDKLINPSLNSTETIKSRLDLIQNTIIYAQKKLRKLNSIESSESEFNNDDANQLDSSSKTEGRLQQFNQFSDLYSSEVKSFAPQEEITAETVRLYIQLISNTNFVHVVDPAVYSSLEKLFESDWSPQLYKKTLKESGIVSLLDKPFVILPLKEDLWALVCINNEDKVLEYYSSDSASDFRVPCSKLEKLLKETEDVEGYDWEIYDAPQETSKNDSGVFMLLMLKALVLNIPFEFPCESIEDLRTLISLEITNKTLS